MEPTVVEMGLLLQRGEIKERVKRLVGILRPGEAMDSIHSIALGSFAWDLWVAMQRLPPNNDIPIPEVPNLPNHITGLVAHDLQVATERFAPPDPEVTDRLADLPNGYYYSRLWEAPCPVCAVCLVPWTDKARFRLLPCHHIIHNVCALGYYSEPQTRDCPQCHLPVLTD